MTQDEQDFLAMLMDHQRSDFETLAAICRESQATTKWLAEELLKLKREGFQPGAAPVQFPDREVFPALVEAAIVERAGDDTQLQSKLLRSANARLQAGEEPEAVAQRIMRGSMIDPFAL